MVWGTQKAPDHKAGDFLDSGVGAAVTVNAATKSDEVIARGISGIADYAAVETLYALVGVVGDCVH